MFLREADRSNKKLLFVIPVFLFIDNIFVWQNVRLAKSCSSKQVKIQNRLFPCFHGPGSLSALVFLSFCLFVTLSLEPFVVKTLSSIIPVMAFLFTCCRIALTPHVMGLTACFLSRQNKRSKLGRRSYKQTVTMPYLRVPWLFLSLTKFPFSLPLVVPSPNDQKQNKHNSQSVW